MFGPERNGPLGLPQIIDGALRIPLQTLVSNS